jgi:DNA invertase Pin-like site-specific DNA recombinase
VKVVGYLRVSTDRQAEAGLGLEVQEEALRSWAPANGHRLVKVLRDEGISGSNGIETRLGLAEALDQLKVGDAEGLVVYRLDRLARDLVLQEQLLAEIWRMGAEAFSTSNAEQGYLQDDPSDPSRKLIRQVLGAVAEYERAMIRLRLEAGRRRKSQSGGYAGFGSPPFGLQSESGTLVPNATEQATLARIRALHSDGQSLRQIARSLDSEELKPRRGDCWQPRQVGRIVNRLEKGGVPMG